MLFNKIYQNLKPFLLYDISLILYLIIIFITTPLFDKFDNSIFWDIWSEVLFYLIFIILFIKLGYSKKMKDIKIGMVLFELKLLLCPVLYMISMVNRMELLFPLSPISLGNIMYSELKPITKLISDVNYNAVICIPDLLLSVFLPILLFYIGYLIKKKVSEKSET